MLCLTLAKRTLTLWAVGMTLGVICAPDLIAEVRVVKTQQVGVEDEQAAEQEGFELRRSRRWIEAIEFYEKSLKTWPKNEKLSNGLRQAKIHFAIERRYADKSFVETMLPLSRNEAMVYLNDVLEKVGRFYVENIDAKHFVAHGTESLYFGLNNQKFLDRNLPYGESAKIEDFRKKVLYGKYWNKIIRDADEGRRIVLEICNLAQQELNLAPSAVIMEFVFGGCNSLDDYSSYLTPGKLGDLYNNIDGEFVGIGIEMKAESGKGLLLVNVLPESPASEGGAVSGDLIVAIDGRDCRKLSTEEAAALLQGQPNSRVRITIADPGTGDERTANLIRRAVKVKSIQDVQIIDPANKIGYIRMTGFQKNTVQELDDAMAKLKRDGMQALIWDVRGNPGGLLPAAVDVLDRFLSQGVLVSTRGRVSDQNTIYSAHADANDWSGPLVLLVDGDSASASEIVAGAVRDHHRGTIVGRKTYGKWSVQSILPGHADSGFRLTTAKFYSPNGGNYSKKGIEPDVKVADDSDPAVSHRGRRRGRLQDDRDVETGLETLRKQLARR
ncbi:S41 family peptidase [Schlesneria paludicola]|uniref:S41 family peptidase n=1 Tax=Schlesneria paludicola TaxID=360056 RepID=UPI00029A0E5E|nr:S41 family peptidase [Schlesneria paludicola]